MSKALKGVITEGRMTILREMVDGPADWKTLMISYYGPERSKLKMYNAFHQQLGKLQAFGYIKHEAGMYFLTPLGREKLSEISPSNITNARSRAHKEYGGEA